MSNLHEWDKDEEIKHLRVQVKQSYEEIERLRRLLISKNISISEEEEEKGGIWLFGYGRFFYLI